MAAPLAAQAADRTGGRQQQVQARPAAHQAAAPRRSPAQAVTAQAQAQVQRSAPMRAQLGTVRDQRAASASGIACTGRKGNAQCRAPRMVWTEGLSPAAGIQANECPDGTMATLARGHDDIIRCMPI
ncbi:hypothetical protein ACFQY5_12200 [Paeniroseomonas aquatica]|uniref:hypothetical protein n=1 Tax=Paeniroseomonas aquatica TaxID=373043 RepID=UPI00361365D2